MCDVAEEKRYYVHLNCFSGVTVFCIWCRYYTKGHYLRMHVVPISTKLASEDDFWHAMQMARYYWRLSVFSLNLEVFGIKYD